MTLKMALYFGFIAAVLSEMLSTIFIHNYVHKKIEFFVFMLLWIIINYFKLFLINYMCERVSIKVLKIYYTEVQNAHLFLDIILLSNIKLYTKITLNMFHICNY